MMEIGFDFPLMMSYVMSYMVEASVWVGRIFIRLSALGVEWLQCLFSPVLEKVHGKRT